MLTRILDRKIYVISGMKTQKSGWILYLCPKKYRTYFFEGKSFFKTRLYLLINNVKKYDIIVSRDVMFKSFRNLIQCFPMWT